MMLEQVCPIMPSRDFDITEAFYARLGFRTWYKDDRAYLLMNRDKVELHFFHKADHRPEMSEHGAYLRPADLEAFAAEVAALGLPSEDAFPKSAPARDMPWGMREAMIWDPDGNLLRVGVEIEND